MDFSDGSNDDDLPQAFNDASGGDKDEQLERLKEALRKQVLGQQEVVDHIASTLLTAPKGTGKTEFALRESVIAGQKVMVVKAEDFKNGAMDQAAGRVFYIDEIHRKSAQEIQDAIDAFMGRPTRQQCGDMAADACRNGTENPVICMKPLRLRRDFSVLTF
jgi:Holliday junction resolvasome RuvABC ATP-dependent DNA helicase subunit